MANNIKEKLITLTIGTIAVSVVIGAISLFNFLAKAPEEKPAEHIIIQPDFSKEDIEKIKEEETTAEEQQNKSCNLFRK